MIKYNFPFTLVKQGQKITGTLNMLGFIHVKRATMTTKQLAKDAVSSSGLNT